MFGVGCQCWLDVAAWMLLLPGCCVMLDVSAGWMLVLDVGDGWILVLDAMAGFW